MRHRIAILATLTAVGIATGCSSPSINPDDCYSIDCMMAVTQQQAAQDCVSALNRPMLSRAAQAEVDRVYGYPLKNLSNYTAFIHSGGRGPSPREWCNAWAEVHLQRASLARR